eukprot:TRINITY_DN12142_c0_g1_i1.p1 TRINITY_DN12142_c0_g1~~TRINITY_DN12142_c0_g1_i1.p1  ORF type:complete len:111 (+),score=41.09 TRINITY_DN12142_c0_g1_i1:38-334(+)
MYPTVIRATGYGAAASMKCLAGVSVPFLGAFLFEYSKILPIYLFCGSYAICGFSSFFLSETYALQDHFEDEEELITKDGEKKSGNNGNNSSAFQPLCH